MKKNFRPQMLMKIFLFAAIFLVVFSFIVMALWNNILVAVLHVSAISFWQALGIFALAKILFGGFHGAHWGRHQWRNKMQQRWANMTPEDREKFKQEWKNRCGRRFEGSEPFEEQNESVK